MTDFFPFRCAKVSFSFSCWSNIRAFSYLIFYKKVTHFLFFHLQ